MPPKLPCNPEPSESYCVYALNLRGFGGNSGPMGSLEAQYTFDVD